MSKSSDEKGRVLEKAVRHIEEMILRGFPGLARDIFEFATRKILIVNGVRHEYDLFVTVNPGTANETKFVFECRNRKAKVDKNDIIVFSYKIDVAGAKEGFFVGRSFTKDARAQAACDPRITLRSATEHPLDLDAFPPLQNVSPHAVKEIAFRLYERGTNPPQLVATDSSVTTVIVEGQPVDFNKLLTEQRSVAVREDMGIIRVGELAEGDYDRVAQYEFHHDPGQLVVEGHDISVLEIRVCYVAQVRYAPVVSHYEIESRGRMISYAPLNVGKQTTRHHMILRMIDSRGTATPPK